MRTAVAAVAAAVALALGPLSSSPTASTTASTSTAPTPAAATLSAPTKVLTIVEENHSYRQMRAKMPYLFGLAQRYGYATHWKAISHPSLPNYLAMAGGSTFGIRDDRNPTAHRVQGPSVFDQAINHGKTAAAYAESMPSRCYLKNTNLYAVRHNPWTYFVKSRSRCNSLDRPMAALATTALPNAGMITPNLCHDAHSCSLGVADIWLRRTLPAILASRDFTTGRLTVVVTADEDDHKSGNNVLTVVMNRRLSGVVVRTPLTHFSLTRYYDQVLGVKPLRLAARAPDMKAAFGL